VLPANKLLSIGIYCPPLYIGYLYINIHRLSIYVKGEKDYILTAKEKMFAEYPLGSDLKGDHFFLLIPRGFMYELLMLEEALKVL